ncbi:glycosyltransferase [Demequina silvatica]|uniref:glycosyltransferase n=1 Tax=Demequina silvatica TaxID=1638988 RepID=UPI0007851F2F|nr:glycosyltransferase [Demequina silvatica]
MWILVPAYEPDARMVALVAALRETRHRVLVVDDGSGAAYEGLFAEASALGAAVLRHPVNRGKAAALRTGFAWLTVHAPGGGVVCADSDGQHTPADVARVAEVLDARAEAGMDDAVVLGVRAFTGDVPWRSRLGNRATTALLAAVTGRRISDTQTGLRGYPSGLLPWALAVPGERFAYELALLLDATRRGIPLMETRIDTVYLDSNRSSHFRPLADSARVLAPLALFAASSLVAFGIDTAALLGLEAWTGSLVAAVLGARVLSAGANFTLNRRLVFRARGPALPQARRYLALAVALLAASYVSLLLLTTLGLPLLAAKVSTDLGLWLLSFGVQRAAVFGHRGGGKASRPGDATQVSCATASTTQGSIAQTHV